MYQIVSRTLFSLIFFCSSLSSTSCPQWIFDNGPRSEHTHNQASKGMTTPRRCCEQGPPDILCRDKLQREASLRPHPTIRVGFHWIPSLCFPIRHSRLCIGLLGLEAPAFEESKLCCTIVSDPSTTSPGSRRALRKRRKFLKPDNDILLYLLSI